MMPSKSDRRSNVATSRPNAENSPHDAIHWGREEWERRHGPDGALSMETVSALVRVREILVDFMEQQLAPLEMSFVEYDILSVIEVTGGATPLGRIKETSRRYFNHQTSVTNIVSRLTARNFVSLQRDDEDARVTRVHLTRLGATRLRKAHETLAKLEFGLAGLRTSDKGALNDLLYRIRVEHDDVE
jgi:DNA-binding MarR family transcriptional regulator